MYESGLLVNQKLITQVNSMENKKRLSTLDVRNGDTYTLCVVDTFFGDISGRFGKGATLGDPGHGPISQMKIEVN